jgi:hypothetical protein
MLSFMDSFLPIYLSANLELVTQDIFLFGMNRVDVAILTWV